MTGMRSLIASGEFWRRSDAETYDAVYGTSQPPEHKRQILENIQRIRTGRPRLTTQHLDITTEQP